VNTFGTPVAWVHTNFLHFEIKVKPGEWYRPTGPLV